MLNLKQLEHWFTELKKNARFGPGPEVNSGTNLIQQVANLVYNEHIHAQNWAWKVKQHNQREIERLLKQLRYMELPVKPFSNSKVKKV